jgi:hypothetical protein
LNEIDDVAEVGCGCRRRGIGSDADDWYAAQIVVMVGQKIGIRTDPMLSENLQWSVVGWTDEAELHLIGWIGKILVWNIGLINWNSAGEVNASEPWECDKARTYRNTGIRG